MSRRAEKYTYQPDVAIPPGETLLETIEVKGMSQRELALRTGITPKTINGIVKGKAPISMETAMALEKVLGVPARFWMNLEQQYRALAAELEEKKQLFEWGAWTKRFPIRELVKRGFMPEAPDSPSEVRYLLEFFSVVSPEAWSNVYAKPQQAAFRAPGRARRAPEIVSSWLRMGAILASKASCPPYDEKAFRTALKSIRGLTRETPDVFQGRMIELCAGAGVALVLVPEMPGLGISGATYWLSEGTPVIQLSLRYKKNDQLWFTFFHEAGHIILHGKKDIFIEENNGLDVDPKELQADEFAADLLIPKKDYRTLCDRLGIRPSKAEVESFAQSIGIAPGIVVGRLQRDKVIPFSHMNDLKQTLCRADV